MLEPSPLLTVGLSVCLRTENRSGRRFSIRKSVFCACQRGPLHLSLTASLLSLRVGRGGKFTNCESAGSVTDTCCVPLPHDPAMTSIFLDKNRRYIGESQSKRPPKCRGRRHARTRLRSQPQPAARLLRRHPVRRHRLRRRRIPHALPPRRRPRPRAHGPVRIYQHACHLCRSPEGALGVCGVARETNITRHPRWLCGVA
jgi:hypothetical protein